MGAPRTDPQILPPIPPCPTQMNLIPGFSSLCSQGAGARATASSQLPAPWAGMQQQPKLGGMEERGLKKLLSPLPHTLPLLLSSSLSWETAAVKSMEATQLEVVVQSHSLPSSGRQQWQRDVQPSGGQRPALIAHAICNHVWLLLTRAATHSAGG